MPKKAKMMLEEKTTKREDLTIVIKIHWFLPTPLMILMLLISWICSFSVVSQPTRMCPMEAKWPMEVEEVSQLWSCRTLRHPTRMLLTLTARPPTHLPTKLL